MMQKKELLALRFYDILWRSIIPLLKLNSRLKDGYDSRRSGSHLTSADVWIQAASAGEAYLALSMIENLNPAAPVHVLVTTNTRQGLDILRSGIKSRNNSHVTAECAYIPFDRPSVMNQAVCHVNPRLMVLLETELWPGLLFALKKNRIKTILVNGRLTPKSLKRYMTWPALWHMLGPDRILAISDADAKRFATLFGKQKVQVMPNIKFDRLNTAAHHGDNPLKAILPAAAPFMILGSVRQPEENQVECIIREVMAKMPETVVGLFPRHMHRIKYWENALDRCGIRWIRRSESGTEPVTPGTVILWDTFGELSTAYALAKAVFVGGSLAPLGGQNFLEPMIHGVQPIIGPSWENFTWAGNEIFHQSLAVMADDWQGVASGLIRQLRQTSPVDRQRASAIRYIESRQGGTRQACDLIMDLLSESKR